MIYFYHGTDTDKARMKAHELIDSLRKKKPDAAFFNISSENFSIAQLQEYIGGQGLFSNKYIVFLDRLCGNREVKAEFIVLLKEISESENIFIVLEGKIDKATVTKIEKKSEKTVTFDLKEKEKKEEDSNVFELANALGRKDKKELWMLYREYIGKGSAPEELHGILFWKAKTMMLAGGSSVWSQEELLKLLDGLITVYHEARRGNHELETGLEAFLLCA
ncbi:MAG: hypothetical protein AAB610_01220 [Patescibacteria group bacterium]